MPEIRRMPLELFPPFASDVPTLMDESVTAMETYKDHLLGLRWHELHNQSAILAGVADKILRDIQSRSDLEEIGAKSLSDTDSGMRRFFSALASDNSTEATQTKNDLLAELTQQLGGDATAAQAALDALLDSSAPLFNRRKMQKSSIADDQDLLVPTYAQLSAAANSATVEASIRLAYRKTDQILPQATLEEGDNSLVNREIDKLQQMHDEVINRLYGLLTNDTEGSNSIGFLEACTAEQTRLAKILPVSAMISGSYLALFQRTPAANEKSAQSSQAVNLFEKIERLRVLHAYTGMVRAEMATVDPGRWYSHEKNRVSSREALTNRPQGTPTTIAGLSNTSLPTGEFIAVKGEVQNLRIEDDPSPPKFSTFFDLVDIETGEKTQMRAHMFSLINNGLSNGAAAHIHGFLRKNEPWLTNVGLDIDRLSLTTLNNNSWFDDITYRVRRYYRLYIDEMNMFFTPYMGE